MVPNHLWRQITPEEKKPYLWEEAVVRTSFKEDFDRKDNQVWRIYVNVDQIRLSNLSQPQQDTVLFTKAGVTDISFAFD